MFSPLTFLMVFAVLVPLASPAQQPERPLTYVSKQCNENAVELRLDPTPFQKFVGSDFSLALDSGKAVVLVVVQDCSQDWINGEAFGLAQEIHVWVAIRGLEDVRPVVGAERTMPTRTWFTVFDGCSNARFCEAKRASGAVITLIDSAFVSPPDPGCGGWVALGKNVKYSWSVLSLAKPLVRLAGLNHDVYERDSAGNISLKQIQVLAHPAAGSSRGTLKVTGEGEPSLIPHGTYSVSVRMFFPVWVRTTLGLQPPRTKEPH